MRPLFCLLPLALAGCFAPTSASQRLGDAAYDMNTATRFGRMDVAMELVSAKALPAWQKQHAGWGKNVRIVDVEFGGMSIAKKDEADVIVNVTWQKPADANIRTTTLAQKWHDDRGSWHLTSEEAKGGDEGLLGDDKEKDKPGAPAAPATNGRYQTRIIYDADDL